MTYTSYTQDRQRELERKQAPQICPHCQTPINQDLRPYDRVRYHCGADKCRKAASRASIAERKRREREEARARVLAYSEQHLDAQQHKAVKEMCEMLMQFSYERGHQIAEQVIEALEAKRCKHDRIEQLEEYAAIWKRRTEATEQQLNARIAELEAELALFNGLEATIHGIAQRQLAVQPDPALEPEQRAAPPIDPDRAQTLATFKMLGIKTTEEALAERKDTEDGAHDTER